MRFKLDQSGPLIGVGGIFVLMFVAFPAFRFAPWWGLLLILLLLLVQGGIVAQLAKKRPAWCAFVPGFGLVAYFVLVFVGAKWWGWGP